MGATRPLLFLACVSVAAAARPLLLLACEAESAAAVSTRFRDYRLQDSNKEYALFYVNFRRAFSFDEGVRFRKRFGPFL